METTTKEIKLSNDYIVILKSFIDRKTMREYRAAIAHNARTEQVFENGIPKMDENGMPMSRVIIDPAQMDVSNDVLVRGIIEKVLNEKGETLLTVEQNFFDSMSSDDFDKILDVALSMMKKKEKEKKS